MHMIRWVGFGMILSGAAATGMLLAAGVRRNIQQYQSVRSALLFMKAEMEFHLTPLDDITRQISTMLPKVLSRVFSSVSRDIGRMPGVPVGTLMRRALNAQKENIAPGLIAILAELFELLGKQDVLAQVRAISIAETQLEREIDRMEKEKTERCRTYRTIGICAGLAVAVVLA